MINKLKKNNKGFTLMETLVAVLLLSIAIAGPLTIASKGIQEATLAKDQYVASYLLQEGVEFMHFARDTNTLSGGNWLTGAGGSNPIDLSQCEGAAGCTIDALAGTVTACTGTCPVLNYDSNLFEYTYNTTGTTPTIFTRKIVVTPIGSDEIAVAEIVTWCDQAAVCSTTPREVSVREDLFNWQ